MKPAAIHWFKRTTLLLALVGTITAHAQWTTQSFNLKPGWNAVYLEVQPEPADCDLVFAGTPVESVWFWNQRFSSVQFIQDPNELVVGQNDWLAYLPTNAPASPARNLFALAGGRPYLIRLPDNANPFVWTIKGAPVVRNIDWLADSFNFVGFHVASTNTLTFQTFFATSASHTGQPVYRLGSTGAWEVVNPTTTGPKSGEAYWVYSKGPSVFSSPLDLSLDLPGRLEYGRTLTEQTLRIRNGSPGARDLTIRLLPSATPPAPGNPLLAGPTPLAWFQFTPTNAAWLSITNSIQRLNVQPGETWTLRLEVQRASMNPFTPPTPDIAALYQSLLEVTDDRGARWLMPVSAEGLQGSAPAALLNAGDRSSRLKPAADGATPHPRAGLWVGSVELNKVSQPANIPAPTNALPTPATFAFKLIVHVDNNGAARLLQKVLQMWKSGTLKPDPADPTHNIVDQPGRYVLVTDDALIPRFTGATLRDGQPVARRISSAAFSFGTPIAMTGNGDFGSGRFNCQFTLDYDDPLNPFKHRFHPDHDNLDERFVQKVPEGTESFTVARQVELQFTAEDPDHLALSGWQDNQLGGIYREAVSGLHRSTVYTEGRFRLFRASNIGLLNDGL